MSASEISKAEYWSARYQQEQTGWDLGAATTVFQDALARHLLPFPGQSSVKSAGNGVEALHVLVPGCGRGHDVEAFARHGYRVTGLDFAAEALEQLEARITGENLQVATLQRDVFSLRPEDMQPVDLVLEYTMYCAIEPARRAEYAQILASLMRPGATLAALNFPLAFPQPGPPFVIDPDEFAAHFVAQGFEVRHRETPRASHPARSGNECLQILRKTGGLTA